MYRLEYLPSAKQDMTDIARYISLKLCNPAAAFRLADEMVKAADGLTDFPYAHPVYCPVRPLEHEYRHIQVQHYLMFYYIDEPSKIITMARVIYVRRDYHNLLK